MISKLGAAIILSVVTLFVATPTSAFALTKKEKKQIQSLQKSLKKDELTPAQVQKIVKQLTNINPVAANSYVKLGLGTGVLSEGQAKVLSKQVVSIVKDSDLPPGKIATLTNTVNNAVKTYTPPEPTPTPYAG